MSQRRDHRQIRYADILGMIAQGRVWSAYLDDTGPGGNSLAPTALPPDRETHIAAVFPPAAGVALMDQMPGALEELRRAGGESEFHFVHIYNGTGLYRKISIATRLAFFEFFAEIAVSHDIRFLVQSIDGTTSAHVLDAAAVTLPKTPGLLDPSSNKDLSRLFLLIKLKNYLLGQLRPGETAPIFLDEGWKRNGLALPVPTWNPPFYEGLVMSADSRNVWGIQFADFAGFVLTRSQILLGRDPLSSLDLSFLEMASKITPLFVDGVTIYQEVPGNGLPDAS
jgi:hypothetical protein